MKVDGVGNYQQKLNFGAIRIDVKDCKDFSISIGTVLKNNSKKLDLRIKGGLKIYSGIGNDDGKLYHYVLTDGRTKVERIIIDILSKIPGIPAGAIKSVPFSDYKAARKMWLSQFNNDPEMKKMVAAYF